MKFHCHPSIFHQKPCFCYNSAWESLKFWKFPQNSNFVLRCNIMLHLCTVIYTVSGMFSLYIHYVILYLISYLCTIKAVQGNHTKISTIDSIVHNIFALYISCHSYTFLRSNVLIWVGINCALVK